MDAGGLDAGRWRGMYGRVPALQRGAQMIDVWTSSVVPSASDLSKIS